MKHKDRELQYQEWNDTKENYHLGLPLDIKLGLDDIVDEVIKEVCADINEEIKEVVSDGSKNNFYEIPSWVNDLDDLSEYLNLDPYEFNILKTLWIHKGKRHNGTNELREINKRLHYAEKSKEKYLRKEKGL